MRSIHHLGAAIVAGLLAFFLTGCGNSGTGNGTTQAASMNGDTAQRAGFWQKVTHSSPTTFTIPEGSPINVRLDDSISTARNRSGDTFRATLNQPIRLREGGVVPRGARVTGEVLEARPSGHLKTPAELSVALTSIEVGGNTYRISTSSYSRVGQSHKKHDLKWIGGSAAGGALLGALIGHGKGAAIGALAGGGGGTAAAYATGKKDIVLPSETPLHFVLRQPITIKNAG
ncbi:MAG TPA: hypothetical protein VGV68_10450 [Terriglobia bacterium]|nr:hypothetical protein [Terriglobia bacterium]